MESEPGAPASTANSAGTTTSSTTNSSNTTAASSSSNTSNTTATTSTTSASSSINNSNSISNTNSSSSSSTTTGRQTVPQISVYSGIPDRQTVQVSLAWIKMSTIGYCVCVCVCACVRVCVFYTNSGCIHIELHIKKYTFLCSTALCWSTESYQ